MKEAVAWALLRAELVQLRRPISGRCVGERHLEVELSAGSVPAQCCSPSGSYISYVSFPQISKAWWSLHCLLSNSQRRRGSSTDHHTALIQLFQISWLYCIDLQRKGPCCGSANTGIRQSIQQGRGAPGCPGWGQWDLLGNRSCPNPLLPPW